MCFQGIWKERNKRVLAKIQSYLSLTIQEIEKHKIKFCLVSLIQSNIKDAYNSQPNKKKNAAI